VTERDELVTAARLGTDRRPLPTGVGADGDEPSGTLLDWAVRAGAARRAGSVLPEVPPAPIGPPQTRPVAPSAAREVLNRLLVRPQPDLLNVWLDAAVRGDFGLAPQHWAPLANLAARTVQLSRPLFAATLGERGRWFLRQNQQWARLAAAEPLATRPDGSEPTAGGVTPGQLMDAATVRADPEAIFRAEQPWSSTLVMAALEAVGNLRLRSATRSYALALGIRLSPGHRPLVESAAQFYDQDSRPGPATSLVREAFAVLSDAVRTVTEIQQAFQTEAACREPEETS
jgi:hypothetical protein